MGSTHEQVNWDDWDVEVSDSESTGLRLYKVKDPNSTRSVTFAEFNPDFDVHSVVAWAAARTSRSPDPYEDIFAEVKQAASEGKATSGKKLESFFVKYGHASVAGMAPVFLYIHGVPMYLPFWMFNHLSIGDGQELSTRYVKLEDLGIADINELTDLSDLERELAEELSQRWEGLQVELVEKYNKWYDIIYKKFSDRFSTEEEPVTYSTLNARTLDIVRMFIPVGSSTSMALITSVRMWIDLVVQLREHNDPQAQKLAEQINATLNLSRHPVYGEEIQADLAGLTKYAYPRLTVEKNLESLEAALLQSESFSELLNQSKGFDIRPQQSRVSAYSSETPMALTTMQYILRLFPSLSEDEIIGWLEGLDDEEKSELGRIILGEHDHHNLMRNMGDIRGTLYVIDMAMAHARDLNRHRAWGRFVNMLENNDFESIVSMGFNDNFQLNATPALQDIKDEFNQDMADYYQHMVSYYAELKSLVPEVNDSVMLNVLPLGHQIRVHMSGPIPQHVYMISQRIAGGGDFSYRKIVYELLQHWRATDPYLSDALDHIKEPDPNSDKEFRDRG